MGKEAAEREVWVRFPGPESALFKYSGKRKRTDGSQGLIIYLRRPGRVSKSLRKWGVD